MFADFALDRRCRRAAANLGLPLSRQRSGSYKIDGEIAADAAAAWARLEAIGAERRDGLLTDPSAVPRGRYDLHIGDALVVLRQMPAGSVQAVVTSPPYFRALDYDHAEQIGQEALPQDYVARLLAVFAEVRRVLRDDGVAWVLLGGTYVSNASTSTIPRSLQGNGTGSYRVPAQHHANRRRDAPNHGTRLAQAGFPLKTYLDIPGMVAAALSQAGWIVRSQIIWEKVGSVPDAARDRPGRNHETLIMASKSARYSYYPQDGEASRSVWRFSPGRSRSGHPAPMPLVMAERCIDLSSKPGDVVLDPFAGSGTTGLAAIEAGRDAALVELNPAYAEIIRRRLG